VPEIVMETDATFLWKVMFNPPLKKGDRVRYTFKQTRPNNRPYTYEELLLRIEQKTYEYKEPICEACEWTILNPTLQLRHEFEFPENYEIDNCYPDVFISKAKLKAINEAKRIKEGNMFIAEKMFDKWVLTLNIIKPLQNHTYYTYYVPSPIQKK
jgi:hypothetical protein